ncbi:hypothetical protein PsorP6_017571 [Peronosclerospora sorghi]|uniref:Uncharacterized protein n=1 Tax=Peronosclerospora sorghi TaxID=230839 RepID=A0ACC0WKH1_9STRA|nr:hypothetical protein PsorP6_017571 [Peronosclerospora sorghi]
MNRVTEILKRCKEDRAVSRAKVDPQVSERNEFTRGLMDQWSENIPQIERKKKALACLKTTKEKIETVEQTVLNEVKSKERDKKNKKKKSIKCLVVLEGEDQVSDAKNGQEVRQCASKVSGRQLDRNVQAQDASKDDTSARKTRKSVRKVKKTAKLHYLNMLSRKVIMLGACMVGWILCSSNARKNRKTYKSTGFALL